MKIHTPYFQNKAILFWQFIREGYLMAMKFRISLIVFVQSAVTSFKVVGQGCSDAGFCTMGAMRPNQQVANAGITVHPKSIEFTQYTGYTKFKDVIVSYILDANFGINTKTTIQFKLPYNTVYGPLANTAGFGDISLSYTRNVHHSDKYNVGITIGTKIPTSQPNVKKDGIPLPMYYQPSLGTYDAVFGISIVSKKWLIATGYQYAFNGAGSDFTWGAWGTRSTDPIVRQYPVSKDLKRGSDIMFRVERNFRFARWNGYIGLLPIYRITADKVYSNATKKMELEPHTKGLALTGLAGVGYRFSTRSSVKFLFGHRLKQRYKNADGLSREWVNTISYEYCF